ncbi:MAG: citrate/2-methylcitrate synthase [Clostridiales bacterium]|nr:citrate/2-methylcitrate synthase [Clostridiales bacterium]
MKNKRKFEKTMIDNLAVKARDCSLIDPDYYNQYQVKRGLRDIDGKGVLVGLTEIGEVRANTVIDNEIVQIPGELYYRGIEITEIVNGFLKSNRFGFEETAYLLLFGDLPTKQELTAFCELLDDYRKLPDVFVRDMILNMPSRDIMNSISRSVLAIYSLDDKADDTSIENVLRQCLNMIACFPLIAIYGYQALTHYHGNNSLYIHSPLRGVGTAENILHLLRPDSKYTQLEARLLDLALVLHAEHGGGNNSSFVTHVVTSSGSDTYSAISAALGSLKGPRHGGANIKVVQMFEDMKRNIGDWNDDGEIESYLMKLLNGEAFDRSGLIYGVGHAVYSISDPRAVIFKEHVEKLAKDKGMEDEFNLYAKVEKLAPEVISKVRRMYKGVSVNIDFYSGFVYRMLDIPYELFTPIFAISRIVGWSAHRIEELVNAGKIIRPAYKSVCKNRAYIDIEKR